MAFSHDIRVRYQEVDMQKVVFNSHYLAYCDEAAGAWMADAFGWNGTDDEFDWMLVRAEIDWRSSATYGDTLTVAPAIERWGGASFVVRYDGTVGERSVFDALITYVSVKPGTTNPAPVPAHVRDRLGGPPGAQRS